MNPRKEYAHQYYLANKERVRARNRAWNAANRGKVNAQARAYRRSKPRHQDAANARRKAARGGFTQQEWQALCDLHDHTCLRCRAVAVRLTPDHVVPLARGGSKRISNIQPLCLPCNLSKNGKAVDYRAVTY